MVSTIRACSNALRIFGALLIFSLLAVCAATPARADATYQYTGQAFTSWYGDDSCIPGDQCQITGTVTFASTLPDSLTLTCCGPNVTPLSFSFTDGFYTLTQSNSPEPTFAFTTNSTGTIVGWNFGFGTGTFCGVPAFDCYVIEGVDAFGEHSDDSKDYFVTPSGGQSNVAGTWKLISVTGAGVPEPSAVLLLGVGLFGLAGMRRKLLA